MPTIKINKEDYRVGTSCLICGEFVELNPLEQHANTVKICDKCKKAVMKAREEMEKGAEE
jgi:hypothetical protein